MLGSRVAKESCAWWNGGARFWCLLVILYLLGVDGYQLVYHWYSFTPAAEFTCFGVYGSIVFLIIFTSIMGLVFTAYKAYTTTECQHSYYASLTTSLSLCQAVSYGVALNNWSQNLCTDQSPPWHSTVVHTLLCVIVKPFAACFIESHTSINAIFGPSQI